MVKGRLFVVISLCFFLASEGLCQKFNYNSQKKSKSEFNEELATALRNDDYHAMGRILSKNPSLVDAASSEIQKSKRLGITSTIPLICDAVIRCLDQQCSVKMVETILSYHPNLNCKYDGLPPFYIVLDYIACHRIIECARAEELFYTFLDKSNIDIRERPAELPPSFSYLLTVNFNFLKGHFSRDYISPELIKAFVDKGASVNTKDVNSNSILSFATLIQNQELIDYCLGSGANVTSTNKEGKDAFYYAVANGDFGATKSILENGYPLSVSRLVSMKMQQPIAQAGNDIQVMLFERLKPGKKNLEELKALYNYFPNQRGRYLSDDYNRANLDLTHNQLPEFIDLFASAHLDGTGLSNLETLKKEYISGSNNLNSFNEAIKKYPLAVFNYSKNYYEKESTFNTLLSDLKGLKTLFSSDLIDRLCQEANERQKKFVLSDWKGNPSVGKVVVDGYPQMYDKVVKELYDEIARMRISKMDYYYESTGNWMKEERDELNRQIRYCDGFINGFGNSSYGSLARAMRSDLSNRLIYVNDAIRVWKQRVSDAQVKFRSLEKTILENGPTPTYEMENWEYYELYQLIGPDKKCKRGRCNVKVGYSSYTFYVEQCDNEDYIIEESGFLFDHEVARAKTLNEGIRMAVWKERRYNIGYFDERVIDFVDFMEKNKNGKWWTYEIR